MNYCKLTSAMKEIFHQISDKISRRAQTFVEHYWSQKKIPVTTQKLFVIGKLYIVIDFIIPEASGNLFRISFEFHSLESF